MNKLFFLGRIIIGIAFLIYGFMHFANVNADAAIVPHFVGFPVFWVYFIGCCWWAVAFSFFINIETRIAGWLASLLLFVILVSVQLFNFHGMESMLGVASTLGLIGGCITVAEGGHYLRSQKE